MTCDHAFGYTDVTGIDRCASCDVTIPVVEPYVMPAFLRDDPADEYGHPNATCTGHEDDGCADDLGRCDACGYVCHDIPQAADNGHDELCCGRVTCATTAPDLCITHGTGFGPGPDEPTPTCDLCGEPDGPGEPDWNGDTGNHASCEIAWRPAPEEATTMTDYDALSLAHDEAWDAAIAAEDEGRPLDEIVALWAAYDDICDAMDASIDNALDLYLMTPDLSEEIN